MSFVTICKGDDSFIRPNFRASEFYSTSARWGYSVPECHSFDIRVIDAFQYLRDLSGVPWEITSSYRVIAHNRAIGSQDTSMHVKRQAADGEPKEDKENVLAYIVEDIASKGVIYAGLRARGINGIGIYDNFIHLDTRENFAVWDYSTEGRYNTPRLSTAYLETVEEPLWTAYEYEDAPESEGVDPSLDQGVKKKGWINQIFQRDSEDGRTGQRDKIKTLSFFTIFTLIAGILIYKYRKK